MVQEKTVMKQMVKDRLYFNFKDTYEFCWQWLIDEGYRVYEERYDEKMSESGKDIKIKWKAQKEVTDYFQNEIKIKWGLLRVVDVEVERNGKKEKTNKGELRIDFESVLRKDYEHKWEDKPIWKFLRGLYDKYIVRTREDEFEMKLMGKTQEMIADLKAFLELEAK